MRLQTIRIMPFYIGSDIPNEKMQIFTDILQELPHESIAQILSKDEFEYIYDVCIERKLRLLIFSDGIGEFVFTDEDKTYCNSSGIDVKDILDERKRAHSSLLRGNHAFSQIISQYLSEFQAFAIANLGENKRNSIRTRLTYVMSTYFFDCGFAELSDYKKMQMYNLLYTDNYYKTGRFTEENITNELNVSSFQNADTLASTHVVSSWASYIVFSDDLSTLFDGLLRYQINIQHLWMYTYSTNQMISDMFKSVNLKNVRTTQIDELFQELLRMKLCVYKYKGIISSTMHEREHKIYQHLMVTSKLNILIEEVDMNFQTLDTRMNWLLTEKRFISGQYIEFLLFLFTLLETFSVIKNFSVTDLQDYWLFFVSAIVLTIYLFARRRE